MIHNHTDYNLEDIAGQPLLKTVRSEWRQRTIKLYKHFSNPDTLISVGVAWNEDMTVVCEDMRKDWAKELCMSGEIVTTY